MRRCSSLFRHQYYSSSCRMMAKLGACLGSMSLFVTSCNLAPSYTAPHFIYPDGWRGKGLMGDAAPAEINAGGQWWTIFKDPVLNQLEERLQKSNPDLQAAAEAFTQARDIARETESQLYPQVSASAGMSRNKGSDGRLFYNSRTSTSPRYESNEFYSGVGTWEPDFWNSIRNTTRMQKNLAQASAANYALVKLSLEAELASDYAALRGVDAQIAVYTDSIRYFSVAVDITRLRQGGAIGAGLDVSRAESQYQSAMAARDRMTARRQVLEHAIAVLLNTAPAGFSITPSQSFKLELCAVDIQAGLPSTLLERRPDIAMAEREMAAAARAIGVSRAAFYPHVTLSAAGGFEDSGFDLASISRAFWTIAVQAVEPAFTGGLRRAALQRSWSQYRQTVDNYRAVVLSAFRDVEDGLSKTRFENSEKQHQRKAVEAALKTQSMTMALYTGGLSNYLDALVAQQDALAARLLEVQAQTSLVQSIIRLARALGGGWEASKLPKIEEIDPIHPLQYQGLHYATPAGEVPNKTLYPEEDVDLSGKNTGIANAPLKQEK